MILKKIARALSANDSFNKYTIMKRITHAKKFVGWALSCLLLASCQKQFTPQAPAAAKDSDTRIETVLGQKQPNPFSFQYLQKAISGVSQSKGASTIGGSTLVSPTHYYVRFAPQNVEQLTKLEEAGFELFDVPLDYDVVTSGDWYQDPSIPDEQITYQYTLVPEGYALPSTIPYTVLDTIFLYNEDAGEEQEPDDWSDGNGDCLIYDPVMGWYLDPNCTPGTGQLSQQSMNELEPLNKFYRRNGDPVIKATQKLKKMGIQPSALYAMSVKLAGYDPNAGTTGVVQSGNYRPKGYIRVENTEIPTPEPVRGVLVKSRNFFKLDSDYTADNGYFEMSKTYNRRAHIIVKFRSPVASIRGINGVLKAWQYVFPVKHNLGEIWRYDLESIDFTFVRSTDPHSDLARKWAAATALNAVTDAYNWNIRDGIGSTYSSSFPFLTIWLSSRFGSGASAPMLQYLTSPSEGSLEPILISQTVYYIVEQLNNAVPGAGTVLKEAIKASLPDITVRYGGAGTYTLESYKLYDYIFHEVGHATHYWGMVKNFGRSASDYWWENVKYVVGNELSSNNPPYGNKTNTGAGRTAVIESWGYYYGNVMTAERLSSGLFSNSQNSLIRSQLKLGELENMIPRNDLSIEVFGSWPNYYYTGWIPCGMLYDFTDVGENTFFTGITDNANLYTKASLCLSLSAGLHNSVPALIQTILNRSAYLQGAEVESLRNQYGF